VPAVPAVPAAVASSGAANVPPAASSIQPSVKSVASWRAPPTVQTRAVGPSRAALMARSSGDGWVAVVGAGRAGSSQGERPTPTGSASAVGAGAAHSGGESDPGSTNGRQPGTGRP
jgi:hypothetical protein